MTNNFEFAALAEAKNYRRALVSEFREVLLGEVIEVGAGIGQMTEHLRQLPAVRQAIAVEPDPAFCTQHRAAFPDQQVLQGTVADLPAGTSADAILSVNVLEHIQHDVSELESYCQLLRARRGALCLFVPARPEIFAPIDYDFGHFRRYTFSELQEKLSRAGFKIARIHYFNSAGYFAWWLNFCVLKKRAFERSKVRFYDRCIFPAVYWLESRLMRPPFGQSLLAIARA